MVNDAAVAGELEAIAARLQALTAGGPSPTVGRELGQIRADLRRLALENEEVGRRLGGQLGLEGGAAYGEEHVSVPTT